jgi:peptidoglycan/LPS O-acetylase OafA/YrhL
MLVVIWHYLPCQIVADRGTLLAYASRALSLTWSGVDLFFVLSGFLITGILLDRRASRNYFQVFYIRRACRIFPLYFLLLGTFLCLPLVPTAGPAAHWLRSDPFPLWSYVTFTQNVLMAVRGNFGPHWLAVTWSLAVEEQFYLFVPVLVYLLSRSKLACVFVVLVLGAPLLRVVFPGFVAYVNTPWRSDSLLSGALLALLVRWPAAFGSTQRHPRLILIMFLALNAGAVVLTVRPGGFGALNHLWLAGLYGTLVLIAYAHPDSAVGVVLRQSPLVWLGHRSYGIYMFHQAVSGLVHGTLRNDRPEIHSASDFAVTLLALLVTLILAEFSYRFIEAPIIRLGHSYIYTLGVQEAVPGERHATIH